jgi:hypothetical protein
MHGLTDIHLRLISMDIGCGALAPRSRPNFGYTRALTATKLPSRSNYNSTQVTGVEKGKERSTSHLHGVIGPGPIGTWRPILCCLQRWVGVEAGEWART